MVLLEATELRVAFGGVQALDGVDLALGHAQIVGLIGPNGAGKTTLFNVLTGFQPLQSGYVRLAGRDVTNWSVHRRSRHGLSRTFQRLELFASLTVRQNVAAAAAMARRPRGAGADIDAVLDRVGLGPVAEVTAGLLPTGQGRLVELARALVTEPRVLLADEPASGLSAPERRALARLLGELADQGLGILVIEHDMDFVDEICHRVVVLDQGREVAAGTPAEIRVDPAVVAAYLGGSVLS